MAQLVKNPPAMQETWIRSLGWKDALEEGMATHFSILAWRIPRTESETTEQLSIAQHSIPLYILYHIFFMHSSFDGHLGYFHVLAIVNSAAMNIEVHV